MSNSTRNKSNSEGSNRDICEPVRLVLHSLKGQRLGIVALNTPMRNELLEYSQKAPQRGLNSEIIQWMESTIIQTSNQKYKGLSQQKEGGKQERSPSSFYQQATSQPTSPKREEEQEKELEENIFPKLQDSKNPKVFHGQFSQHGKDLHGIQGQRGAKNEKPPFFKEITFSPYLLNTLTEIRNSILPLKDIKNSLLLLKELSSSILSLSQIVVQNKNKIDNIKFMVENNKPKVLTDSTQKLIQGQQ
ncbi:hypothetical protein O181_042172 [Austropuccinia psidii MF-1]|uniref:Uncharacterized protein n=1 Tax=Austropuccinia psidii MF-1 TaxID=1389203 RepID=A0A9Q3DM98_9BASI|nr:hypothetical protein [Austropuccinia psidii MF-1]